MDALLKVAPSTKRVLPTHDQTFFESPGLLNSYWAGFIGADGYIDPRGPAVKIHLAKKDLEHLSRFKHDINYTGKITERTRTLLGYTKAHTSVMLGIYTASRIVRDLEQNYRITTKKSLNHKPPVGLSHECSAAYIAGIIDGDGCIGLHKNRVGPSALRLNVLGSPEVLEFIRSFWVGLYKTKTNGPNISIKLRQGIHRFITGGKHVVVLLDHLLTILDGKVPLLERKWKIARENLYGRCV